MTRDAAWLRAALVAGPVRVRFFGRSMEPTLWPGVRAKVVRCRLADLRPGHVAVVERGRAIVAHRVVTRRPVGRPTEGAGGGVYLRGDAQRQVEGPFDEGALLGRIDGVPFGPWVLPVPRVLDGLACAAGRLAGPRLGAAFRWSKPPLLRGLGLVASWPPVRALRLGWAPPTFVERAPTTEAKRALFLRTQRPAPPLVPHIDDRLVVALRRDEVAGFAWAHRNGVFVYVSRRSRRLGLEAALRARVRAPPNEMPAMRRPTPELRPPPSAARCARR